jgi:uroporphyrinogen-III decarboxylase
MSISMSSRRRMLAAIDRKETDHIPCAFMSFTALRKRVQEDFYALCKAELDMGLDSFMFVPSLSRPQRPEHPELRGLPVRFSPQVETRERVEQFKGQRLLHKEYHTPGGVLTTRVKVSEDWPHGDHVPFIDDYQVPRAIQPLVSRRQDLDALGYLLTPPAPEDVLAYHAEAETAGAFCNRHGVLLAGGWGVGMDMANWLCGMQELMVLTIQDEPFIADLLDLIFRWNRQRMEVLLSAPLDLYIKRAWYEGCDFVTPRFYGRVILPRLKKEVELAHENGVKFGYIITSGLLPMLDLIREAGIDVLIGIDPIQGTHMDLSVIKQKLGDRMGLWGGVSGAVTVELGAEAEIRRSVRSAIQTLGPSGFILSPVDNITVDTPLTWRNLDIFIDEWKRSWRD